MKPPYISSSLVFLFFLLSTCLLSHFCFTHPVPSLFIFNLPLLWNSHGRENIKTSWPTSFQFPLSIILLGAFCIMHRFILNYIHFSPIFLLHYNSNTNLDPQSKIFIILNTKCPHLFSISLPLFLFLLHNFHFYIPMIFGQWKYWKIITVS